MKKKIKFNFDAVYNGVLIAKVGDVLELEEDFALRWIRRGNEEVKEEIKKEEAVKEAPSLEEGILAETAIAQKAKTKVKSKNSKEIL